MVTKVRTVSTFEDYISLAKPRVVLLHLVTAACAMFVAVQGIPPAWTLTLTLLGGALVAGSAHTLNCFFDRDLDRLMKRTRKRSLPGERIEPFHALVFGLVCGAGGIILLGAVNATAAGLAGGALVWYVLVYTLWLKRSTVESTVIGGVAGAMPPVVAWVAVTGRMELAAFLLFAIVFLWTPPHFWALALWRRTDYEKAGIPVLPLKADRSRWQVVFYSAVLVAVTLLYAPANGMGGLYLGAAAVLGACLLYLATRSLADGARGAKRLYLYSMPYLAALFAVMVIDGAVLA